MEPPVGTIAMLFTDVEGSTELATRLGGRWAGVLTDHHRLMGDAITAERGYVDGTDGDAFFATFTDAAAAGRAAVAAQRALRVHAWPDEVGELKVRMGLHVGHVRRQTTGYVGLEVHRAARVSAAAHGGQLLLTGTARDLVGDEVVTEPIGVHRLKDFPSPQPLFCAVIDGRGAAVFPPPRAADARTTNLPAGSKLLLGRDDQAVRLRQLLTVEGERLVTLTGRGGVGKTSLAVALGTELLEQHPGGVWLARLATATEPEQLVPAVAAAIGAEAGEGGAMEAIVARLSHRGPVLLVLDNLERLVAAAPAIAEMLARLPDLRILGTSQVPLQLDAEHVFVLDALDDEAALELVMRTIRRRALTVPAGPGRAALLEIVHLLEGMPLSLELAAARLALLAPQQLLERLRSSLELLQENRADRPERQRSLLATVEWTLDLLGDDGRRLFERLGVFAGPVELEDVETVLGGDGMDVLDALASLLDVALVRRIEDGDGRIRFGLPEALRQIAVRRLAADPEHERWRRAHAQRACGLMWAARSLSVPRAVWNAAVAADPEAEAAMGWARASNDQLAIQLAIGRAMVLGEQGRNREALEISRPLVGTPTADPDQAAWIAISRAYPLIFCDQLREAQTLGQRAVDLAVESITRYAALRLHGLTLLFGGDPPGALVRHRELTAMARELSPELLAGALTMEAQSLTSAGDLDAAEEAIAETIRVGDAVEPNFVWKRHTLLGDLALMRGRPGEALAHYLDSCMAAQERNDELQTMFDLIGAAMSLAGLRRDTDALEVVGMVQAQSTELGDAAPRLVDELAGGGIRAAERRQGPAATAEHNARGRALPAVMRVTRLIELARSPEAIAAQAVITVTGT